MFAPKGVYLLKDEEALGLTHQSRALLLNLTLLEVVSIAQLLLKESLELVHTQTIHLSRGEIFE